MTGQQEDDISASSTNLERHHPHYTEPGKQILVFYGTEYGFSEEVANILFEKWVSMGYNFSNLS